jgi:hypothetical protein
MDMGPWASGVQSFFSGAAVIGLIAHAVNTFPMPKSAIGRWALGVIQYGVGQRTQGTFTMNGGGSAQAALDTAVSKVQEKTAEKIASNLKIP